MHKGAAGQAELDKESKVHSILVPTHPLVCRNKDAISLTLPSHATPNPNLSPNQGCGRRSSIRRVRSKEYVVFTHQRVCRNYHSEHPNSPVARNAKP